MTKLRLTNGADLAMAERGLLRPEEVRRVEVEALVDTGATMLAIPADVAERLGAPVGGRIPVRYADGRVERVPWVGGLWVEILGRAMTSDALVQPAGSAPLIGQLQLERLDLIVDAKTRDVHVNPASPDAPLLDLMAAG